MGKIIHKIKVGDKFATNSYGICKIIKIISSKNVHVKFIKTGAIVKVQSVNLRKGNVKDPLVPTHQNIGYLGIGKFSLPKYKREFQLWCNMLKRCYDTTGKWISYSGCIVVKRWHNFQLFCKDITKMPNHNTPGFELDKDLRVFGNKEYSNKTCSFVPRAVNCMLNGNSHSVRSSKYYGVRYNSTTKWAKKYYINVSAGGKSHIKYFLDELSAYKIYLKYKLIYIKEIVLRYKKYIHKDVYNSITQLNKKDLHKYLANRIRQ